MYNTTRRRFLALAATAAGTFAMPAVVRAAPRKLRFGHNNTTGSIAHASAVAFRTALAEASGGRFEVEIYPGSQLGAEAHMLRSVQEGVLELMICPMGNLASLKPVVALTETPYLFADAGAARKALDGAFGDYLAAELRKDSIVGLGWAENGFRHMTANKPVRSPADLKGLKLRVPASKLQVEVFRGLGAEAGAIPFSELPEALRVGRFEAQENPIGNIVSNEALYKLQSHLSLTRHVYSPYLVAASADVLEELPDADRALFAEAGKAAVAVSRRRNDELEKTGIEKLKQFGMTIVDDVDVAAFQKAVAALDTVVAGIAGADALAKVRGMVA